MAPAGASIALVHCGRIRNAIADHSQLLARCVLSTEELVQFASAATRKRRAELLAGRLAAKIVCLAVRHGAGGAQPRLNEMVVRRHPGGAPQCLSPGGPAQPVSITHSGEFAVAIATRVRAIVGIDVEPTGRRLDPGVDGYFHPLERLQLCRSSARDADARRCWTVRETFAKVTGRSIVADLDRVATLRNAGLWWLAIPASSVTQTTFAAASTSRLTMALAFPGALAQ